MDGEVQTQVEEGDYTVTAEHEDFDEDAEEDITVDSDDEITLTLGEDGSGEDNETNETQDGLDEDNETGG